MIGSDDDLALIRCYVIRVYYQLPGGATDGFHSRCASPCGFFFQAEDGIRDLTVTGVQTCALPIFVRDLLGVELVDLDGLIGADDGDGARLDIELLGELEHRCLRREDRPVVLALEDEIGRASCRERV